MRLADLEFKNHPILGNLKLNFTNENGMIYENIILVGENGCGKTTILRELNHYDESKYIINKQQNFRFTSGKDSFRPIFVSQDIKYRAAIDEINKLISRQTLSQKKESNINIEDLQKSNIVNSNILLSKAIAELNDPILVDLFKNNTQVDQLMKGIGGILNINNDNPSMEIEKLSSGEQELALRLMSLKSNIKVNTDFIILDEPETGLHPKWQLKLFDFIQNILKDRQSEERDAQLFIATHSENILKSTLNSSKTLVIRLYREGSKIVAKPINELDRILPYISYPEIQYIVFDIPTTDYHNQLYGILPGNKSQRRVEEFIRTNTLFNSNYNNPYNYERDDMVETLPTYIRNAIHHPENQERHFTENDLKTSIEFLRSILKQNQEYQK